MAMRTVRVTCQRLSSGVVAFGILVETEKAEQDAAEGTAVGEAP